MATKELQIALKLLAQTSEFQAQIARASTSVDGLGSGSAQAGAKAEAGMKRAEGAAKGAGAGFDEAGKKLTQFIAGFVGLQSVRGIIKLTDDASGLAAKLNLVTDSQEKFAAATSETFAIAQRSRSDLGATVDLYSKLQRSFDGLGGSQAEALKVTETITKSFAISGASAEASASAITQFAQGLNKGVLNGDELNSVLEQSPRLATALAAGLGVSVGALKDLGEKGKITAAVIKDALLGQGDAISAEFAQIPLKTSDALTQLANAGTFAFGQLFGDGNTALAEFISVFAEGVAQLPQTLSVAVQESISFFEILYIGAREEVQHLVLDVKSLWLDIQSGALLMSGAVELIFAKLVAAVAAKLVPLAQTVSSLGAKVGIDTSGIDGFVRGLGVLTNAEKTVTESINARGEAIKAQRAVLNAQHFEYEKIANEEVRASLSLVEAYKKQAEAELAGVAASTAHGEVLKKNAVAQKTAAEAAKEQAKAERERVRAVLDASNLNLKALNDQTDASAKFTQVTDELAAKVGGPAAAANLEYARTLNEIELAFAAVQAAGKPTDEQLQQYADALLAVRQRLNDNLAKIAENDPINRAAKDQAEQWVRTWNDAGGDFSRGFAQRLAEGENAFKAFGASLKDVAKRIYGELVFTLTQKAIVVPIIAQLTGGAGGGISGLLNGGGGGGAGGAGGIGSLLSTITGFGGGSPAGAGGGILGAVPSLFGSIGAGLAGLAGGFGAFTGALTVASTAGIGAATSFGLSSLAAGSFATGIGALIPVVGQIAAVAGIVNSLSGGRLFGTSYKTNAAGVDFQFGAGGASGNTFEDQSRRRSIFSGGGTARRTQTGALNAEQTSGINEIQAAAEAVGRATAAAVGRAFIGVVAAEFKTTVDKDGKVISEIGRALGAEYKVSIDEFARVISAETAIAQLPDVASAIAQKFRGSVESIVDASQFLVTAQAQISAGQGLFEGDNALQLAADAVARLGNDGESLLASYTRISGATALFDQALALTGENTKLARAELVDFATGIAEAAGGLDQAAALYQRFFQSAYSEQERGLAQLAQAEARRNALLAEAGLGADTTIATLRASIEQLMRTGGDPAALVLLLKTVDAIQSVADSTAQLSGATTLYEQALALIGQTTLTARGNAVEFANSIAGAAGGLDKATALYTRFFQAAYTEQELGLAQFSQLEARRNALFAQAGLGADTTLATLRASIEELLRTGADPAKLVLLLQAAGAIQDLADILTNAVASVDQFAATLDDRFRDLGRVGFTDFERQLLGINDQLQDDVAQLQATRREMVARGATTEQLAAVDRQLARAHQFAAAAAIQAINQLRAQGRALIAQLRGGRANYAEQQAQAFADAGAQAFNDIAQAAQQAYEAQLAGIKSIQEYLDGQLLGNLSSLTPEQRLAEAQSQFNAALLAAQGGDADALRRLTQLADTVLREGRAFDPSAFPDLEAQIRASLQEIVNAPPPVPPGPPGAVGGPVGSTGGTGLSDNGAEEFAASQAELSLQIAAIIRQLIAATGDSLGEVAATLGLNITELVSALGINLSELTAGSVQSLGRLANSLGVELVDLADEVGVSLGSLADEQSLLNDALEAEIANLPKSQRDQLQPLLDAVEASADNPAGLVIAQAALEAKIKEIGGDAALKLAPYFDDIDPIDPLVSIDSSLRTGFADVVAAINNIGTFTTSQPTQPEGSFAVGTSYVQRDMLANIHQGEAVIDADSMRVLRQYGVRVVSPQGGGDGVAAGALIAELRQLRTEVQTLRATVARGDDRNVMATVGAAELQSAASDRIARAQNQGRRVMS